MEATICRVAVAARPLANNWKNRRRRILGFNVDSGRSPDQTWSAPNQDMYSEEGVFAVISHTRRASAGQIGQSPASSQFVAPGGWGGS